MVVTLLGIVTFSSIRQKAMASSPIEVTGFPSMIAGISKVPEAPELQPVM